MTQITTQQAALDPLESLEKNLASTEVTPAVVTSSTALVPAGLNPDALTKITKFGSIINVSQMPQEEIAEVMKLVPTVTLENEGSIQMYAFEPQKAWSDGLSQLLGASTLSDAGQGMYDFIAQDLKVSTEIVQEAMSKFRSEKGGVSTWRQFARTIPVFGKQFTYAEVLIESRKRLTKIFEELEAKINACMRQITEGEVTVDILMKAQVKQLRYLRRYILAGEQIALNMQEQFRKEVATLGENPDPLIVADLRMKRILITSFETKLVGLYNAYMQSTTILPTQLQTIKEAGKTALANLQDTLTVTIPNLKTSAIQLVALNQINDGNKQSAAIRDQADHAARQTAELLDQTATAAKEQQGKVLDDAQRISELIKSLVATQEKMVKLDEENSKRRKDAMKINEDSMQMFQDASKRALEHFAAAKAQ